jgi:phosphoglycolate phosphatase
MAVCTNKTEGMAVRLLTALGMAHRFAAITGQDTFAFRKPDPRHLTRNHRARRRRSGTSSVMVGDSRTDIDTAKAAGIPVVAVDFGYTERHVREFEPSRIISHFDELTPQLAQGLIAAAA